MKTLSQSKTVKFNVIMGGVEALHGGIHLLAPLMSSESFAVVSLVIGMIHAMGGVYFRSITSEPVQ